MNLPVPHLEPTISLAPRQPLLEVTDHSLLLGNSAVEPFENLLAFRRVGRWNERDRIAEIGFPIRRNHPVAR